jgi:hypothetical protein
LLGFLGPILSVLPRYRHAPSSAFATGSRAESPCGADNGSSAITS